MISKKVISISLKSIPNTKPKELFKSHGTVTVDAMGNIQALDYQGQELKLDAGDILFEIINNASIISSGITKVQELLAKSKKITGNSKITHVAIVKEVDNQGKAIMVDSLMAGMLSRHVSEHKNTKYQIFKLDDKYSNKVKDLLKNITPEEPVYGEIDSHSLATNLNLSPQQKPKIKYDPSYFFSIPAQSSKLNKQAFKNFLKLIQYNKLNTLPNSTNGEKQGYVCSNFCLTVLQSAIFSQIYDNVMNDPEIPDKFKVKLQLPVTQEDYIPKISDKIIDNWADNLVYFFIKQYLLRNIPKKLETIVDNIPEELKLSNYVTPMELASVFQKYQGEV